MAEKVMNNVKEKLSKSRELCEGMSERVYLLADYMSEIASDTITPSELATCLSTAIKDTYQDRWRGKVKNENLIWYLSIIPQKIRNQAVNIPQLIDEIADTEFSEEFRTICKERLGFNPPKRGTTELMDYPEYVKVAVNWWANALFHPKLDTPGSAVPSCLVSIIEEEVGTKSYSGEELLIFQITLADEIMEDITAWGVCNLSVDYHPCDALEAAGKKVGVHKAFGYPLNTYMSIWKHKVEVRVGNNAKFKTLWTK